MREIRTHGSEGGETGLKPVFPTLYAGAGESLDNIRIKRLMWLLE